MKKGKVFGKSQIAVAAMVLALGAAIWLNMKYSSSSKYLGQATYVSNSSSQTSSVKANASAKEKDENYFETVKQERKKNRTEAQEAIEETLKSDKLTEADKTSALAKIEEMSDRMEQESNIESLIKAKGFKEVVAVIGGDGINVVVKSDGLTSAQTLQIQDIVTSQTSIPLSGIKIITIK